MWRAEDPQGGEADKVKYEIVAYTRGKGVDLGCGPKKAFPHFIGVDSCKDTELFNIEIKPDVACEDATKLDFIESGTLDFVFSSHLLEHIEDTPKALTEWFRVLKVGGFMVLYLPHADLYPRIGMPGSNPDHKHDFLPDDVLEATGDQGWDLLVQEVRDARMEYSFLLVLKKRDDGLQMTVIEPVQEKTVCVVRYGGFGDSIQAANILPELKRQGYHVTFMTTPNGQNILKHDPHVDAWLIQDVDQVPNHELPYYWEAQARRFDRFIQLSESVEGTLLAFPGRANHMWPANLRRQEMGTKNYLEWTARLAELPYKSEARFYPSPEERMKALQYLTDMRRSLAGNLPPMARLPRRFVILWALSGSSMHKFYPHQDKVIAQVLATMPEAVVVFSGDEVCKILEAGWETTERVRCESGEMGIRDTLTLAQVVDCVVGPETGVLNAVAFEPMAKVVLLSHSSQENLSKHWENTATLTPASTPCYPCHRLHLGKDFCVEDAATGAAACQVDIAPELVFAAIRRAYAAWKELGQTMATTLGVLA